MITMEMTNQITAITLTTTIPLMLHVGLSIEGRSVEEMSKSMYVTEYNIYTTQLKSSLTYFDNWNLKAVHSPSAPQVREPEQVAILPKVVPFSETIWPLSESVREPQSLTAQSWMYYRWSRGIKLFGTLTSYSL